MQRLLAITWLTWKAALSVPAVSGHRRVVAGGGGGFADGGPGRRHGARVHPDFADVHFERHHRVARPFDPLAGVRHAGARHRGMPDAGRGDQTHRALADLAGQMARHHVAERGAAGPVRRVRLWLVAMARGEIAGGGANRFARAGAGGARFGEGTQQRCGN